MTNLRTAVAQVISGQHEPDDLSLRAADEILDTVRLHLDSFLSADRAEPECHGCVDLQYCTCGLNAR